MDHRIQENPPTHWITNFLQRILKDTNQQPGEEMTYIGRGPKQRSFCPLGVGAQHDGTWSVLVPWFPNLEALRTPSFWDFMKASLHMPVLVTDSSPCPFPGGQGVELKLPTFF